MPDQPSPATADGVLPPGEDMEIVQAAVMTQLLVVYPAQLTMDELTREMVGEADDFASRDQVHNAVHQLVRSGLLHRHGPFVIPTRAAVRFNELPDAGT